MQCRTCGTILSPGTAFCSHCGTLVIATRPDGTPETGADDQTILASQTPPPPQFVPFPSDPYSAVPPLPSDPYSMPPVSQTPYQASLPPTHYGSNNSVSHPYGMPGYSYGTAPMPESPGTSVPSPPVPFPSTPKKRSRGRLIGLIVGILALLLVLSCAGFYGLAALGAHTISATATATATALGSVPPDTAVVASAVAILSSVQMSSAVDSNYAPTNVTSTFTIGQTVYITFTINSHGNDGYIMGKWYLNGGSIFRKEFHHVASHNFGYFSLPYQQTGNGAFALYWCIQQDCSDAQLAQVEHFTVTN